MAEPLDAELDALFQLSPEQLVAARNALSDRLRKSGDREAAARVKALKRPTPAAWALNQVHFHEPELLQSALIQAQQLRELHAANGVDPMQLTAALEAQRSAMNAIVDVALNHLQTIGQQAGPVQQRRLLSSVQGWLAGLSDEAPGRMTQDVEASGFDALSSVGTALPRAPVAVASAPAQPSVQATKKLPDPLHEEAQRELAAAEHAAKSATERVRRLAVEHDTCQRELERAQAAVRAAEAALQEQRNRLQQRQHAADASQSELDAAETQSQAAQARVVRARQALSALKA